MDTVLELKNIWKRDRTGRSVLRGGGLLLNRGERVCVLCEAAAGARLAALAAGLERPDSGEALVLGRELAALLPEAAAEFRGANIGRLSGEPYFWRGLTVLENTAMPLTVRGIPDRERTALAVLETAGVAYAARNYPGSLSPGELRLAALARALVRHPALLILEDADAGLDRRETARFRETLERMWAADRFAVLSVTSRGIDPIPADRTLYLAYGHLGGEAI